jgi:hypothetical protein
LPQTNLHFFLCLRLHRCLQAAVLFLFEICRPKLLKIAARHITARCFQKPCQVFHHIRRQQIIRIHKSDIVSFAYLQPQIPCRRYSSVFRMNCLYPSILPGKLIADFRASIRGTVVYQQNFHSFPCLSKNALHAPL